MWNSEKGLLEFFTGEIECFKSKSETKKALSKNSDPTGMPSEEVGSKR